MFGFCAFCWGVCVASWRQRGALPEVLKVPRQFVGVFAEGDQQVTYGDSALASVRYSPCSTFKIVSALMGLADGAVESLESRQGYDGSQYEYDFWEGDLTLLEAFCVSCVPYFTKLMNRLKKERVSEHLRKLGYGNCDLSAWTAEGHHVFWIGSSLRISVKEQIAVERRILEGRSPFTAAQVRTLRTCMDSGTAGPFRFYGKTGSGRDGRTRRLEGWYVGFAEASGGRRVYFALHGRDDGRDVTGAEMRETAKRLLPEWGEKGRLRRAGRTLRKRGEDRLSTGLR